MKAIIHFEQDKYYLNYFTNERGLRHVALMLCIKDTDGSFGTTPFVNVLMNNGVKCKGERGSVSTPAYHPTEASHYELSSDEVMLMLIDEI